MSKIGPILDSIYDSGLMITKLKMCQLTRNEAFQLYQEHQGKPFLEWVNTFYMLWAEVCEVRVILRGDWIKDVRLL